MADNYYPIDFNAEGDSFVITNNGTAPAPCVITFIPKVDFYVLTIEGLSDEPITMSGIKAKDIVVIDAETRSVTVNDLDAFDKYNAWEFPKLKPGANTVTIKNGVQASI
jgi:phage-related protein